MYCNLKQNRRRRQTRKSAGFTLAEVLVAVLITAILFAAVFAGISANFTLLTKSREDLRATQIAVSRLEALHLEAWGNSTNQPTQIFNTSLVPRTFTDYFYPQGLNSTTNQGTVYTGTVNIYTNLSLSPSSTYGNSMALIVVTVSWDDITFGKTTTRTRTMSTYIAQRGIQNYIYTH